MTSPLHFGAEIDHLFILILWITGIDLHRHPDRPGLGSLAVRRPARTAGPPTSTAASGWKSSGRSSRPPSWSSSPSTRWAPGRASSSVSAVPKVQPLAEVTARQFQWKIRYPGPDGRIGTRDDLHAVNDLRFVQGRPVVIDLKTEDVLHSFFLPQPPDQAGRRARPDHPRLVRRRPRPARIDLVCAELCGWGHYQDARPASRSTTRKKNSTSGWTNALARAEPHAAQPDGGHDRRRPRPARGRTEPMNPAHPEDGHEVGPGHASEPAAHAHAEAHGHAGHDDHIHPAPSNFLTKYIFSQRPQGHRHPVPVLRR